MIFNLQKNQFNLYKFFHIFQGVSLIKSTAGNNEIYGWVTIGMNWLPGLVAATHIVSMYRKTISAKRTLTVAGNTTSKIVSFLAGLAFHTHLLFKLDYSLIS